MRTIRNQNKKIRNLDPKKKQLVHSAANSRFSRERIKGKRQKKRETEIIGLKKREREENKKARKGRRVEQEENDTLRLCKEYYGKKKKKRIPRWFYFYICIKRMLMIIHM